MTNTPISRRRSFASAVCAAAFTLACGDGGSPPDPGATPPVRFTLAVQSVTPAPNARAALTHVQNLQVGQGVRGVCLVDFENDGDADLVATAFNDNHVAFFRNFGGTFAPAGTMDVGDGE